MTNDFEILYRHPHGAFEVKLERHDYDSLSRALLAADKSYVMLDVGFIDALHRRVLLDFVEVADELTNGVTAIAEQRRREEARLQFAELHEALLQRGYTVLSGRVGIATAVPPGDVFALQTEIIDTTAVVVTTEPVNHAFIQMPVGSVAERHIGVIKPTRELEWDHDHATSDL